MTNLVIFNPSQDIGSALLLALTQPLAKNVDFQSITAALSDVKDSVPNSDPTPTTPMPLTEYDKLIAKHMRAILGMRRRQQPTLANINDAATLSVLLSRWLRWLAEKNRGRYRLALTIEQIVLELVAFARKQPLDILSKYYVQVGADSRKAAQFPLRLVFRACFGLGGQPNSRATLDEQCNNVYSVLSAYLTPSVRKQAYLGYRVNFRLKPVPGGAAKTWQVDWDAAAHPVTRLVASNQPPPNPSPVASTSSSARPAPSKSSPAASKQTKRKSIDSAVKPDQEKKRKVSPRTPKKLQHVDSAVDDMPVPQGHRYQVLASHKNGKERASSLGQ